VNPAGLYTYPDASIICDELEFDDDHQDTITNPTILVEVLSDSTKKYDRGTKSILCRQIPALKELVLIGQNEAYVGCFTRQSNGDWLLHEVLDLTGSIELSSVQISIPLSKIYRGVAFREQRLRLQWTEVTTSDN
jgi:Uma2 family endonuclease